MVRDVNGGTDTAIVTVIVNPTDLHGTAAPDRAGGSGSWPDGGDDGRQWHRKRGTASRLLHGHGDAGGCALPDLLRADHADAQCGAAAEQPELWRHLFTLDLFLNNVRLHPYVFPAPVTVTISYNPALLNGLNPASLTIYYWDEAAMTWANDGITIVNNDTINHRITFLLAHLSQFAAFGAAPTALEEVDEPTLNQRLYLPVVTK